MKREYLAVIIGLALTGSLVFGIMFSDAILDSPNGSDDGDTPTSSESPTEDNLTFSADTDTGDIVLRLSDLSADYNFSGETVKTRDGVAGNEKERFEENGILKQHERAFKLGVPEKADEKPVIIISSVTIYENKQVAEQKLQQTLTDFEDSGATVAEVVPATGINATQVKFENEQGLKNIFLYGRQNNLVFHVVISGNDQYYEQQAEELFIRMLVDLRS